jgi:Tol biopolymer transport system component
LDRDGIARVPEGGGTSAYVIRPDPSRGELSYRYPWFLPDGEHFLYSVKRTSAEGVTDFHASVASLDGKVRKQLFVCDTDPVYASGYVLCARTGKLFAWPFDLKRLEVTADPIQIADRVSYVTRGFRGFYSVSRTGILLYREGQFFGGNSEIIVVDRGGNRIGTIAPSGGYWDISLTRDGRRLAGQVRTAEGGSEVWVYDTRRDSATRITSGWGAKHDATPIWSADERSIFIASGDVLLDIYRQDVAGAPRPIPVLQSNMRKYVCDVSRDGQLMLFASTTARWIGSFYTLATLSLADGGVTPFGEGSSRYNGKFSPDGKWVAYVSNDSGRVEIYISPLEKPSVMTRVSTAGGRMPYWSADGRKLYFASLEGTQIEEVDVRVVDGKLAVTPPRSLFNTQVKPSENTQFVVTPDDQRFIINASLVNEFTRPYTMVTNWPARLKR